MGTLQFKNQNNTITILAAMLISVNIAAFTSKFFVLPTPIFDMYCWTEHKPRNDQLEWIGASTIYTQMVMAILTSLSFPINPFEWMILLKLVISKLYNVEKG